MYLHSMYKLLEAEVKEHHPDFNLRTVCLYLSTQKDSALLFLVFGGQRVILAQKQEPRFHGMCCQKKKRLNGNLCFLQIFPFMSISRFPFKGIFTTSYLTISYY